jgi:phosphate starvation-inducible PhoH-like protein
MGRKRKRSQRNQNFDQTALESCYNEPVNGNPSGGYRHPPTLKPRNITQSKYINTLNDQSQHIIFAVGPAGTGKTMIAVHKAIEAFKNKEVDKIVITRPAVSVDEEHGFLPGDLIEKMMPWMRPVFDIFYEHFSPKHTKYLLESEKIEIAPLAYMRGRTFKDCWIVADEMQNATPSQMKMLLTRIGDRSRMVVTGDLMQHDRGYEKNGLDDFISKLKTTESNGIVVLEFHSKDIERHPAVVEVLNVYGDINPVTKQQ